MKSSHRVRSILKQSGLYLLIIGVTLGVMDLALIMTGLFPPPSNHGVAGIGWVAAPRTGEQREDVCTEFASGQIYRYARNEDGLRTSHSAALLKGPGERLEVAVTGDSHTDLCAPNDRTHFGFTETALNSAGTPSATYAYGAGRYSPLQAYLAIKPRLDEYEADVLILNLYTGNDFYDLLRVDDRPYLVRSNGGYRIADPVWYLYDAPGEENRSRILYAVRAAGEAIGVSGILLRLRFLRDAAREQEQGFGSVLAYVNDLRRASSSTLGYSAAYSAQMLNQQLFFHHFPGSRQESLRRTRAVLDLIRAENPNLTLVLSPIPSYQIVEMTDPDSTLVQVMARLPITTQEAVQTEEGLYWALRDQADAAGWIFVDNLTPLRRYEGSPRLYNDFDYHIEPVASEIIGRQQAEALLEVLDQGAASPAVGSAP